MSAPFSLKEKKPNRIKNKLKKRYMLGKEPLSLNPSNTFWEERRLIKAADNVVEKWSRG